MSAADTIEAAAAGRLPEWAAAAPGRYEHMRCVAALMDGWAERLGLDEPDRRRWRAAAWLHDALRDADPETLRALVPAELRSLDAPLLHGPAAAARLGADGVADGELLRAVAYHSIGHPGLDLLGRALFLADYLEPGRGFDAAGRAALRARLPEAMAEVLASVAAARIRHQLEARRRLRPETLAFWNSLIVKG